ncbi:methyltransferase [Streptomyces mirabilis]|uniref:Methyltransferase n=1 Tax=Streptomyces mirabilis TaxID=68239 RepID=A0ABU3V5Z8_9ACTN|nr:methyltransferase [Streptomyces mirabilis]MCX5357050.1 methyltransferase [Streptomyces mirabilis]MDU9001587.1 methyltransferase [Streptomyces mirabilis]
MSEQAPQDPDDRLGVGDWEVREEEEVEFLGNKWSLLPSVYPMARVRSSRFFWERLKGMGPVDSFLEMGCGSGAASVLALKAGMCRKATAVDINPVAVKNTLLNAKRHGVGSELRAVESDLYDSLEKGERYDLIFWNSPGVFIEDDAVLSAHERSIFDPGYATHTRYFTQASDYLSESGRLMLGFCGMGNLQLLEQKASAAGLSMEILAEDGEGSHPHWLLEFRSDKSAAYPVSS